MATLPGEEQGDPAFPRARHWLIAVTLLLAVTLIMPVLAGLV